MITAPQPEQLKAMSRCDADRLCAEIRRLLVGAVAENGGHLSSNLGVVELTVAMHRALDMKTDRIIWDVGHQCYTHKILTGRARELHTLRQEGGISGFPNPAESDTDCFIAGHSSTAISAANGFAKAKKLSGEEGFVVAVVGDGAMTGGLAYEGLCNAGQSSDPLIIILNDNRMSISQSVGFIARHLSKLRNQSRYMRFKRMVERVSGKIPFIGEPLLLLLTRLKVRLKNSVYSKSTYFEDMGYHYLGPVDGHDIDDLDSALQMAKSIRRPVLLHVETIKGKGYTFAQKNPDTYHGVGQFDVETGETAPSRPCFSAVFGEEMCAVAAADRRIVAMTAAMKYGTCLARFGDRFRSRFFDVGIAESHAVTFSSGLAKGGMLPVFAVYSTFLQRCYDQLLNDTALNGSHIVLAIDRAGVVPDDGDTHQGLYDVAFLRTIPGVTIYAPASYIELRLYLRKAIYNTPGIAAVRYPKGGELPQTAAVPVSSEDITLIPGRAELLAITYGRIAANVLAAGSDATIMKLNRIWPIGDETVTMALDYPRIVFFEEGTACGGIGEWFAGQLMIMGYAGRFTAVAAEGGIGVCTTESGLRRMGLDAEGIARALREET